MNVQEQVKTLENGKGIQYLVDCAYKIFDNPITVFDTSYTLRAYSNVTTDDPIWNELISTGTFSLETQEFFASESFIEAVANADKTVFLKSSKLKYDRILGNIENRDGIKVANIVMVLCKTPFKEDEEKAFEALVDKITEEVQNDEFFTAYGKESHDMLINKLLDKVINEPKIFAAQVQILYEGFDDYLYAVVVDVMQSSIYQSKLAELKKLLESIYPFYKFGIYDNYIVIIISSKFNTLSDEQLFTKLDYSLRQNGLYVGISSSFENFFKLREFYDQAVSALQKGREKNKNQRVFLFKP